jgi:hypothetical protein
LKNNRFWDWFCRNAELISKHYDDVTVINELDGEVAESWPGLSWEIGPDPSGGWYFALSPNLDREKAKLAQQQIELAPKVPGWRFYSAKQPKYWNGKFNFFGINGETEIDASNWEYVLLRYPDGESEILLFTNKSGSVAECDQEEAAAIVLQSILGENCILQNKLTFELSSNIPSQFVGKQKPIKNLPNAFGMSLLVQ